MQRPAVIPGIALAFALMAGSAAHARFESFKDPRELEAGRALARNTLKSFGTAP